MITPILALFLLVMSAGAASAAPIAAAIVGLIGLTGTAASFATAVIGIGLSLGARTLLSSLLSPSEPDVSPASLGASAELRFGSRVAHELAFGEGELVGRAAAFDVEGCLVEHGAFGGSGDDDGSALPSGVGGVPVVLAVDTHY